MPIDPCGAFCDYIRRPYTTKARFFRDSDTEVDIVWYPCRPGAPKLAVPSFVGSLDWWVQERELGVYQGRDIGEVPFAARRYNSEKVKPNADGLHRCGTDDEWLNGAVFDAALVRGRRADGLPLCCPGLGPKGILLGGRALPVKLGTGLVMSGNQPSRWVAGIASCADMFLVNKGQLGPVPFLDNRDIYNRVCFGTGSGGGESWNYFDPMGLPIGLGTHLSWPGAQSGTLTIYTTGGGLCSSLSPLLTQDATLPLEMDFDHATFGGMHVVLKVTDTGGLKFPYDVFLTIMH